MPVFVAKHNELKLQEQGGQSENDSVNRSIELLGTIRLPNNMNMIHGNLPRSNYETDRPPKEKKQKIELQEITENPVFEEVNTPHYKQAEPVVMPKVEPKKLEVP